MPDKQKVLDLIPESLKPQLIEEVKQLLQQESSRPKPADSDVIAFAKKQNELANNQNQSKK